MKTTKKQLKQIIKEEISKIMESPIEMAPATADAFTQHTEDFQHIVAAISNAYGNERVRDVATELVRMVLDPPTGPLNEQSLAGLVSSALEQVPADEGTEYKAVRNILNQLASDPSEETMRQIISLAGKGRPSSISGVTLTAKTIGHPLLSAVATKLGPDHAVFRTNLGRYAKGYIKKLAELGMIQEAYTEKRLAKAMAQTMKDPGSYYYNLKSSSEDPSSYYGGEDNRPEEIKAINQIANRMYNLELMISQTKKMPERIQQVKQSIQQAASMEGAAAEEAKKAEQALQSLLQNMPKF